MQLALFTPSLGSVALWTALLIWGLPELVGSWRQRSRPGAIRRDRRSEAILLGSFLLGLMLAFAAMGVTQTRIPWQRPAFFWTGILLILAGVCVRWYAIRVLGASFTRDVAVRADQVVVDRGPYRLIRHPSYSGTLVTLLGVGLTTLNWASLVLLVGCSLAGLLYRVRVEEQALLEHLGAPYAAYMGRTHRFIPYVI
jgi:protein-S-isoprenylcysteine O-methyltransferase Ste14